jgi:hypothetical protein
VSPLVAYLATADCRINGKVFFVRGGDVALFRPWTIHEVVSTDHRWSIDELAKEVDRFADVTFDQGASHLA